MRTRTSPRNQEILWKALGKEGEPPPPPIFQSVRCWDCRFYPKGGRARATCRHFNVKVDGITEDQACFQRRTP